MRTIEDVLLGLKCIEHECEGCPYENLGEKDGSCLSVIYSDCGKIVPQLIEANEVLRQRVEDLDGSINMLLDVEHSDYWENICKLNAKQEIKGKNKYGMSLEDNTAMNIFQRIEYLQEELIDALKYCEHIKAMLRDVNGSEDNTK